MNYFDKIILTPRFMEWYESEGKHYNYVSHYKTLKDFVENWLLSEFNVKGFLKKGKIDKCDKGGWQMPLFSGVFIENGDTPTHKRDSLSVMIIENHRGRRLVNFTPEIKTRSFDINDFDMELLNRPQSYETTLIVNAEVNKITELRASDTLSDKAKEVFGGVDNI